MRDMTTIDFSHLSPEERLDLIGEIWDSLEAEHVPLTPEQAAEIDRRLKTADADLATSVPWETLRAELANRYR
jgi:putative addiction module component (TIGR02574 family)